MPKASRTGQKHRTTSITVEAEADIDDFSTEDLIDELAERADKGDKTAKRWLRETPDAPGWSPGLAELQWQDVEAALIARDFDVLARWLWPQVKNNYPKSKLTTLSQGQADAR